MNGQLSEIYFRFLPIWSKPTDKAWSTLSVDCCPLPNVQVPKAIDGMVVPKMKRAAISVYERSAVSCFRISNYRRDTDHRST